MITISQLRESSMRYIDSQSIALIYMTDCNIKCDT